MKKWILLFCLVFLTSCKCGSYVYVDNQPPTYNPDTITSPHFETFCPFSTGVDGIPNPFSFQ